MKDTPKDCSESAETKSTLKQKIRQMEELLTEATRTEEALRESEAIFRFFSENMTDMAFTVDMELHTTYVTPSIKRVLGFTPAERKKQKVEEQLTPQALQLVYETVAEEMKREESGNADPDRTRTLSLDYYHKDGSIRNLEAKLSGMRDKEGNLKGFYGLSRDITEWKRAEEDRKQNLENLRKILGITIQVMISLTEARDSYTAGHQQRVADLARAIATEMRLPRNKIECIRIAASIHDVGKMSIPSEILTKPSRLSDTEFALIKEHPLNGYEILKNVDSSWPLAEIVYQHHERMNGSGYPRGLKGEDILLEARIIGVADTVEAMASHRPYRPALGVGPALEEIEKNAGILYDPDIVKACVKLFRKKGFKLQGSNMTRYAAAE